MKRPPKLSIRPSTALRDYLNDPALRSDEFANKLLTLSCWNPKKRPMSIMDLLSEREATVRISMAMGIEALEYGLVREYLSFLSNLIKDISIQETTRNTYKNIYMNHIQHLTPHVKKMRKFSYADRVRMSLEYGPELKRIKSLFKTIKYHDRRSSALRKQYPELSEMASDRVAKETPRNAALFILGRKHNVEPSYFRDLIAPGKLMPKTKRQRIAEIVRKIV